MSTATVIFENTDPHGFGHKVAAVIIGDTQADAKMLAEKHNHKVITVPLLTDASSLFPPEQDPLELFQASLNPAQKMFFNARFASA